LDHPLEKNPGPAVVDLSR